MVKISIIVTRLFRLTDFAESIALRHHIIKF